MARLDYNEDNIFGTESRGDRYDIYCDGVLMVRDVSEHEVDRLCEQYERKGIYNEIEPKLR